MHTSMSLQKFAPAQQVIMRQEIVAGETNWGMRHIGGNVNCHKVDLSQQLSQRGSLSQLSSLSEVRRRPNEVKGSLHSQGRHGRSELLFHGSNGYRVKFVRRAGSFRAEQKMHPVYHGLSLRS